MPPTCPPGSFWQSRSQVPVASGAPRPSRMTRALRKCDLIHSAAVGGCPQQPLRGMDLKVENRRIR